jgi:hypothetical protein
MHTQHEPKKSNDGATAKQGACDSRARCKIHAKRQAECNRQIEHTRENNRALARKTRFMNTRKQADKRKRTECASVETNTQTSAHKTDWRELQEKK